MKWFKFLSIIIIIFLAGCEDFTGSYSNVKSLSKMMLTRWTIHGADIIDVNNTLDKISLRQNNWVAEWVNTAQKYEKQAEELIAEKNFDDAKYLLMKSSVYYRLAAFPYPLELAQEEAYKKCVQNFISANKFFSNPPERVEITLEGKKIIGNFRRPIENKRYPLVILIPGLDSNKEELYWIEDRFLNEGWATFTLDMPGTGESNWALRVESERVFQAVFTYFQKNSYILKNKIAVVGFDFGGYWAVRLAAQNNEVLAAVNVAGPIDYAFQTTYLAKMPLYIQKILQKASGESTYAGFSKVAQNFSLKKDNILDRLTVPCLVINAKKNFLVPLEDTYIFSELGHQPGVIKVFPEEQYGFSEHLAEVYSLILNWLKQYQ
ncbi:MAG: alpha/beta fold hydrolase [Candidatus Margulisbacteria bacterium]|nr:alpha/beta fold hydrolase [Candidatus Margulisiibacteriota bacterium]